MGNIFIQLFYNKFTFSTIDKVKFYCFVLMSMNGQTLPISNNPFFHRGTFHPFIIIQMEDPCRVSMRTSWALRKLWLQFVWLLPDMRQDVGLSEFHFLKPVRIFPFLRSMVRPLFRIDPHGLILKIMNYTNWDMPWLRVKKGCQVFQRLFWLVHWPFRHCINKEMLLT